MCFRPNGQHAYTTERTQLNLLLENVRVRIQECTDRSLQTDVSDRSLQTDASDRIVLATMLQTESLQTRIRQNSLKTDLQNAFHNNTARYFQIIIAQSTEVSTRAKNEKNVKRGNDNNEDEVQ